MCVRVRVFVFLGCFVLGIGVIENSWAKKQAQKQPESKVAESAPSGLSLLKQAESFYRKASSITAEVHKKTTLGILGRVREQSGQMQIVPGHLRLDWSAPRALTLVTPHQLWSVEYGEGVPVQVIKMSAQQIKNDFLILFLSGRSKLSQTFRPTSIKHVSRPDKRVQYDMVPRKAGSNIQRLQVELQLGSAKKPYLTELSYWDALENQVQVQFRSVKFGQSIPASVFEFQPPKGAQVVEF